MEKFGYKLIDPKEIPGNLIKLIADEWMLVTAGTREKFNTMTANWGGAGYLWNRPVAFVFIRPERYTFEFAEQSEMFTLSFYDEKYRNALNICGVKSGRDCDKVKEAKLTPIFTNKGLPAFEEAKIVLEVRKIYADMLSEDAFLDKEPIKNHYLTKGNLHKLYIVQIEKVWIKA